MCQQLDCTNENPELKRYSWKFQKTEENADSIIFIYFWCIITQYQKHDLRQTAYFIQKISFFKFEFVYNNGYVFVGNGLNHKSSGGFVLIRVYGVLFLYV